MPQATKGLYFLQHRSVKVDTFVVKALKGKKKSEGKKNYTCDFLKEFIQHRILMIL